MLIYLAELDHGNYVVSFAGRRYPEPASYLLQSLRGTLRVFPIPCFVWGNGIVSLSIP